MRLLDMEGADFAEKITSSRQNEEIIWGLDSNHLHALWIVAEDDEYETTNTRHGYFQVREGDDLEWLGRFIGQCTSLITLEIGDFPGDADQINKFIEGINRNRSIQYLTIEHDCGNEMFEELCVFFLNNKNIGNLTLQHFDIDHESAGKLASTICDVPLKYLTLRRNELSNEGFETIVTAASGGQSQITNLCVALNSVGQVGCTTLLRSGALNKLKDLDLSDNNIDDNSLQTLTAGLVNNTTIEQLSLSGNQSITSNGLRYLVPFLQSESCPLTDFYFYYNTFDDSCAAVLAHGLGRNKSLKKLWFNPATCRMTSNGWQSFATLLCDTSSINATYQSNHTIELIGESCDVGSPVNQVHKRVRDLLRMNANVNSRDIAKCKIFLSHRDLNVEPMFEWGLKFLPLIVTWFGKIHDIYIFMLEGHISCTHCSELSVVYTFIRGMPELTAACYWQKFVANAQIKRRRIEDETRWLDSERLRLVQKESEGSSAQVQVKRRRIEGEMWWFDSERLRLVHEEEAAWARLSGRP